MRKEQLDKLKQDPEKYETWLKNVREYQAKQRSKNKDSINEKDRERRKKVKDNDPSAYQHFLERNKRNRINRINKLKQDPEAYAEFLKKQNEKTKRWQAKNRDGLLKRRRARRAEKRDVLNQEKRKKRAEFPFKTKWESIKSYEKGHGVETTITEQDLIDILNSFENKCFNCKNEKRLVYDHFYPIQVCKIPLSKENCVVLCITCNGGRRGKNRKHPEEFFSKEQIKILKNKHGIKIKKELRDG